MVSLPIRRLHPSLRRRRAASVSRRRALQGIGAVLGAATFSACADDGPAADGEGSDTGTSGDGDGDGDGGGDGDGDGDTGSEEQGYEVCEASDLSPQELLSGIDHIVVVMMENRSFDHYFGALQLVEDLPIDGLTGGELNPALDDSAVNVFNTDKWIHEHDPPHGWDSSHAQWNQGANDRFVQEYQLDGAQDYAEVMSYYLREQLPVFHSLVDEYVLCDRWFASVMGPTWPNRFYLHCASSDGTQSNDMISGVASVFDQLSDAGITHRYYYSNLPFTLTYGIAIDAPHMATVDQFFTDLDNGELPSFCMVEPTFAAGPVIGNDDHPPADVREGQAFIATIYEALAGSPHWDRCLLVITYDEHGGFHDHVPPPTTTDPHPGFEQLGFRVPSMVIGGQVRAGCVNGTVFDHASVAATLAARFGLEPLNERAAAAEDLSSCVDPELIDNPRPPIPLPRIVVPRTPRVYVPGGNFGGQDELAALIAKGESGRPSWVRASQRSMERLRDHMIRRGVVVTR